MAHARAVDRFDLAVNRPVPLCGRKERNLLLEDSSYMALHVLIFLLGYGSSISVRLRSELKIHFHTLRFTFVELRSVNQFILGRTPSWHVRSMITIGSPRLPQPPLYTAPVYTPVYTEGLYTCINTCIHRGGARVHNLGLPHVLNGRLGDVVAVA